MLPWQSRGWATRVAVSATRRAIETPAYRKINRADTPVLVDDDTVVETLAVLSYMMRATRSPLFGRTPMETARVWQTISECDGQPGPVGDISRPLFRNKVAKFRVRSPPPPPRCRTNLWY